MVKALSRYGARVVPETEGIVAELARHGRLVQGPETPFKLILAEEPEQVLFNKDGEILAEELLVNRSW